MIKKSTDYVICFYTKAEIADLSFVHLMKFSAKNRRLRKATSR